MDKPRAADDFAAIRARMEELRREVERGEAGQTDWHRQLDWLWSRRCASRGGER